MRLIALLLALLAAAFLVKQQLAPHAAPPQLADIPEAASAMPRVPTQASEVQGFKRDMNDFMAEQDAKRAAAIDKAASE
ncbi:hypothetical protein ACG0Z6_14830 [Roseateles sp. BYS180W]|uniref:Uncharacterized protein n=1 Tax=Roseateles rivi TaxID=3299028 RepID=A0ABW7FZ28_9BURK